MFSVKDLVISRIFTKLLTEVSLITTSCELLACCMAGCKTMNAARLFSRHLA